MNSLAYAIIAAEREAHIRNATTDLGARQIFFNPASSVNKIDCVVIVLFNARGNRKDIRIKNNIFGWKANFID